MKIYKLLPYVLILVLSVLLYICESKNEDELIKVTNAKNSAYISDLNDSYKMIITNTDHSANLIFLTGNGTQSLLVSYDKQQFLIEEVSLSENNKDNSGVKLTKIYSNAVTK